MRMKYTSVRACMHLSVVSLCVCLSACVSILYASVCECVTAVHTQADDVPQCGRAASGSKLAWSQWGLQTEADGAAAK